MIRTVSPSITFPRRAGAVCCVVSGLALLLALTARADYDGEIAALVARDDVQRAFAAIDAREPDSLAELIELTEIPAPPFHEERRGARFAEMLREAGLEQVETDAAGNVLGRYAGAGAGHVVAIVAHLDTVFPVGTSLKVRKKGARYYAPGIGDNSRGLVVMLSMVRALKASGLVPAGDLLFVASVGEEGIGDLRGVKHLLREGGPRIDEFIAIDGGNDARVLNHAIGSHRYRLTFRGPGGHSWGAFGLANPAHALSSAIHYFEMEASDFVRTPPRTAFNIGRIGGGTSVNAIPFESWAEIDMRSEDPTQLDLIDSIFRRAVARALVEHNEARTRGEVLTVEVKAIGDRPSGRVSEDTPLIQRALAATRYFGIEPVLGSGSTDANVPIAMGIPATTISRGGTSAGAHSLNEWWSSENSALGVKKALLLALASTGVRERPSR